MPISVLVVHTVQVSYATAKLKASLKWIYNTSSIYYPISNQNIYLELSLADCPKVTSIPSGCIAASMLFHVTPKSNGYFENVWGWVADHDLDDAENTMVTIAVARGFLLESQDGPTWLYGTASEHSMLYQYNFYNTRNLFAGMIQTESVYFQYIDASSSPGPFKDALGIFNNDPDFSETCDGSALQCNFSWAAMFSQVSNVTIAGAGLYSWFDAYDQSTCVDAQNCQQRLILDQEENGELWIFNLVTIGAVEMISNTEGAVETAKENTQANAHPFWSALAVWGDDSDPVVLLCDDDSDDPGCKWDPACDLTKEFADLDALVAAQGSFPVECAPYHAVNALGNSLETSLGEYDDANTDYDEVWSYYAEGFRGSVDAVIRNFTHQPNVVDGFVGPGLKYFDCTISIIGNAQDETKQCPFTAWETQFLEQYDMTYTLRDANGFYDELNKTFAIQKDWVGFTKLDNSGSSCSGGIGGHPGNGPRVDRRNEPAGEGEDESSSEDLQKRCGRNGFRFFGIPKGNDNYDVPNPKDAIVQAMPKMLDLQIQIMARGMDLATGDFNGTISDISQALSLPVFMMAESIEQMKAAKEEGKKIKNQKDLEFLEKMLGVVFMFLPFLDELAPELLLFEGMATALSFVGGTALAIKDIVEHPENAFMDVIGIVTDAAFLKTGKGYKDAADARRGIKGDMIGKSGSTIKKLDDKLQGFLSKSCAK